MSNLNKFLKANETVKSFQEMIHLYGVLFLNDRLEGAAKSVTKSGDCLCYKAKSDSVQLVHDCRADIFYMVVEPIDPMKKIEAFYFSSEKDAVSAFKMWATYMETVVYEQFKNF